MFWIWIGIVISLALIEILTINLTTIWFVASGLVSLVISIFIDYYIVQLAVFVIGGFLLMVFTKSYLVNKLSLKGVRTNLDRVLDMVGVVTVEITKNKPGEVKVDGKRWSAISDEEIAEDETIEVLKIDGVKLIVKKVEE